MSFRFKLLMQRSFYINIRNALIVKGFPFGRADRVLHQTLAQTDYYAFYDRMKWDVFQCHFQNNEKYRKLCGGVLSKWDQIPIIDRLSLRGGFMEWISQSFAHKNLFHGSTSGSSGIPFQFARDKFTHAIIWASIQHYYSKAGVSLDDLQARFYGILLINKQYWFARFKDWIANRYRFNVYDVSNDAIEKGLDVFKQKKFRYIYGYTHTLLAYANYLDARNLILKNICPSLISCIVTSEFCTEEDAQKIELAFGIPVYNEYGCAEIGVIGFKRGFEKEWEAVSSLLFIEVLDEQGVALPDGQPGLLTYTHLYNKATPLIRYQTGDIGTIRHDEEGKVFITSLEGRVGDIIELPDGKKVPTFTFYYVLKDLIVKGANIEEFVVVMLEDDSFVVRYVAPNEMNRSLEKELEAIFAKYVSDKLPITTQKVDSITRGANGKLRHFISEKSSV